LLLVGCTSPEPGKDAQQQSADAITINRQDLKLLMASSRGDTPAMQAALKAGANVNCSIDGLGTPITMAGMSKNPGAVQFLLDQGANVNTADSEGYTALINAVISNDENTVELLVSKGADVNSPADLVINGRKARMTPLLIAQARDYKQIVKLLTDAGAK
jgi:ankyrin repeat protein